MIDLHSHLMPGVDDGAEDLAASVTALQAFAQAGVTRVVTTPHLAASLTRRPDALAERLAALDAAFAQLVDANRDGPSLALGRGVELLLDDPDPDLTDPRLRLDGTAVALVEFSLSGAPPYGERLLARLVASGVVPLLAHVERYREVRIDPDLPRRWRAAGAVLQMNFGSLIGQYGRRVEATAWQLLADGLVDILASDYHARGVQVPQPVARDALVAHGALAAYDVLATVNPTRLLAGDALLPVPLALR